MELTGRLMKATLIAFKKSDMKVPDLSRLFVIPINPQQYSRRFANSYSNRNGSGNTKTHQDYERTPAESISLDFYLDGTGTVEGYPPILRDLPVALQIAQFLRTVYQPHSDTHEPSYVMLVWGDMFFRGRADSVSIEYTLFDTFGLPIRAKVSVSFREHLSDLLRSKLENFMSPDVTHRRTTTSADRLDLMVDQIYDTPRHTLQIAKANNLTSIRNLPTNRELTFPPIEKNT